MNWENNLYVRLYIEEGEDWCKLGWEGQTVLLHLLRKFDAKGKLFLKEEDRLEEELFFITNIPKNIIKIGIHKCLDLGVLKFTNGILFQPNYTVSQNVKSTSRQRNKRARWIKKSYLFDTFDIEKFYTKCDTTTYSKNKNCNGEYPLLRDEASRIEVKLAQINQKNGIASQMVELCDEASRIEVKLCDASSRIEVKLDSNFQNLLQPCDAASRIEVYAGDTSLKMRRYRNILKTLKRAICRQNIENSGKTHYISRARMRAHVRARNLINLLIKFNINLNCNLNFNLNYVESGLDSFQEVKSQISLSKKDRKEEKENLEKKKKSSLKNHRSISRKNKSKKPKTPKRKQPEKSDPAMFRMSKKKREEILKLFEIKKGGDTKIKSLVKNEIVNEVIRIYKLQRKKHIGSDFVRFGERGRECALNIGLVCIGNETTPEMIIDFWCDQKNNWTKMKFPPITFLGSDNNLETAVISLKKDRKIGSRHGHSFDDNSKLHPEIRETLRKAGFSEGKTWTDRDLLTIQKMANMIASNMKIRVSGKYKKLVNAVIDLFREGSV